MAFSTKPYTQTPDKWRFRRVARGYQRNENFIELIKDTIYLPLLQGKAKSIFRKKILSHKRICYFVSTVSLNQRFNQQSA